MPLVRRDAMLLVLIGGLSAAPAANFGTIEGRLMIEDICAHYPTDIIVKVRAQYPEEICRFAFGAIDAERLPVKDDKNKAPVKTHDRFCGIHTAKTKYVDSTGHATGTRQCCRGSDRCARARKTRAGVRGMLVAFDLSSHAAH
jgi:hypothetical protein